MRHVWLSFCVVGLLFASCARLSVLDESCLRTADCASTLRCLDRRCAKPLSEKEARRYTTVEKLARAIVHGLKRREPETFKALLPSDHVLRKMAGLFGEKKAPEKVAQGFREKAHGELPFIWQKLLSTARRQGIDLQTLRYVGVRPYRLLSKKKGRTVIAMAVALAIHVQDKRGRDFLIKVQSAFRIDRDWYLMNADMFIEPVPRTM